MAPEIPFAKRNRCVLLSHHQFNSESLPGFSDYLGKDGKLRFDGEALVVDSHRFKTTRSSSLDHYKYAIYSKTPIQFSFSKEEIAVMHVANKQMFSKNTSDGYFPSAFSQRVTNMQADPRIAHGFVQLIGISQGVQVGFYLTNDTIYVATGVDPTLCQSGFYSTADDDASSCTQQDFDCNTYKENPAWQKFKMNLLEDDFSRYLMFREWQQFCQLNGTKVMDWDLFKNWRNDNPQACGLGNKQMYSDWRSNGGSFDEYCIVNTWNRWIVDYKQFYPCMPGPEANCNGGYTGRVLFGNSGVCGSAPMCSHYFSDKDQYNCYGKDVDSTSDSYGVRKNCCCTKPAHFLDLIPVARRETCDPLMDWLNLGIGIDRATKQAKFFIGNEQVYQATIGMRQHEQYRVLEFGGYSRPIDLEAAVFAFGTGTIVDASLPDNYFRYRVTNDSKSRSALTNLVPASEYKQLYKNETGELVGVEQGANQFFSVLNQDTARVFGQGDIFKIKYFALMSRSPVRGYENPRNYAKTECCGASSCKRSCLRNDCEEECDTLLDYIDPRELQIEFEQPGKKRMGDDYGYPNAGGDDAADGADGQCIRAKIVKLGEGQRYWSRQCTQDFVGINLY